MNKQAFTLVELLVVVLIIGILTAVALPKYQVAVQKSRYATLMPVARAIKNAEEVMYMTNAAYSSELDTLGVRVPGTINGNESISSDGLKVEVQTQESAEYVKVSKEGLDNVYVMFFKNSMDTPDEIHCEALSGDKQAEQVCLSYGGVKKGTAVTPNYTAYVLEGDKSKTNIAWNSSSYSDLSAMVANSYSFSATGPGVNPLTGENGIMTIAQTLLGGADTTAINYSNGEIIFMYNYGELNSVNVKNGTGNEFWTVSDGVLTNGTFAEGMTITQISQGEGALSGFDITPYLNLNTDILDSAIEYHCSSNPSDSICQ